MSDEHRFERLKAYNKRQCSPSTPEKELLDIIDWIKRSHTGNRAEQWDKMHNDHVC